MTDATLIQEEEDIQSRPRISDIEGALRAYAGEPLSTRLFIRGRHWLCPMRRIAREVPRDAHVLDIGCGHGLFDSLLASQSARRQIVGIDVAEGKIAVATRSARAFSNVRYVHGSVLDLPDGGYDGGSIIDVLDLRPDEMKLRVLKQARRLVTDDGVLLLKTNDTHPRWKFATVCLEEWLMVKLLRYTAGGQLHFRGVNEYLAML